MITYIIMYMETKKEQKNETKEKRRLTGEQRQLRRKMLVYPLMGLTFLGCMWLIFSPSQEDREKERQGQGFNTDMPQPEKPESSATRRKPTNNSNWRKGRSSAGAWWATCPRSGTTRT